MYLEDKARGYAPTESPTLEPWRQELLDAAKRIEERGWCQDTDCDEHGRVCIVGALLDTRRIHRLGLAGNHHFKSYKSHVVVSEAIKRLEHVCGNVPGWNDTKGRTKEHVIAMLKHVATAPDPF